MSIRQTTPESIKNVLRKMKTVPIGIKAKIYGGCKDPGATIQFNSDVAVYSIWEAILYVESYESQGFYAPGTAKAAIDDFMTTKAAKKAMA